MKITKKEPKSLKCILVASVIVFELFFTLSLDSQLLIIKCLFKYCNFIDFHTPIFHLRSLSLKYFAYVHPYKQGVESFVSEQVFTLLRAL